MNLEVVELSQHLHRAGETLTFRVKNIDSSLANGLRRTLLAEVPTLAIDSVTIVHNSSVLPDEMIAHRLGLVPLLSTSARDMNFLRDCPCNAQGCHLCSVEGSLNVTCPDSAHSLEVYSNDLFFKDPNDATNPHDSIRPVSSDHRGVWLLTLGRTQAINLRFVVRKGIAKVHAKFMPTATVAMRFTPEILLNNDGLAKLPPPIRQQFAKQCPRDVFMYDDAKQQVSLKNPDDCIYCRECMSLEAPKLSNVDDDEETEAVDLPAPLAIVRPLKHPGDKYDFTFVVESTGVLPVVQLLYDALGVLRQKLSNVKSGLERGGTLLPTRTIGTAPTAPRVVDEERLENRNPAADDLAMFLN
jgi:DNA-directed RNA polymerase II subunit RPB3